MWLTVTCLQNLSQLYFHGYFILPLEQNDCLQASCVQKLFNATILINCFDLVGFFQVCLNSTINSAQQLKLFGFVIAVF